MNTTAIRERVREIVASAIGLRAGAIDDGRDLFVSGLDSMSMLIVVVQLETVFGISLPLEDLPAESFRTVSSIVEAVTTRG